MMARDPGLNCAVENSTYENNDREFRLERYDMVSCHWQPFVVLIEL